MKKVEMIGAITLFLGIGAGDSENLLIPLAMIVAGALMTWIGGRYGSNPSKR